MRYLDEADLTTLTPSWDVLLDAISGAVDCLAGGDFAQPIKPYLRYGPPENRIIAMPAFVGGAVHAAGLKWIASFPRNIEQGIPRAHSVVILNDADTGAPTAIVNGALLSVLRTAAVTGYVLRDVVRRRPELRDLRVGLTGFGPIGRRHANMVAHVLSGRLAELAVFDLRGPDRSVLEGELEGAAGVRATVASSWQDSYRDADVFITCTVAPKPYIDLPPKPGSVHLNVSLRDYDPCTMQYFEGGIFVDDWDEVCREATDIEVFHKERGLRREDTGDLVDIARSGFVSRRADGVTMFNPMGMAVFDVAIAAYFANQAAERGVGRDLSDVEAGARR